MSNEKLEAASSKWEASRQERLCDQYESGLYQIAEWGKAYPLKNFPEPTPDDWKKIAEVLEAAGLSLDCISASNMRYVVSRVSQIAAEALETIALEKFDL